VVSGVKARYCSSSCWTRVYNRQRRERSGNLGDWRTAKGILLSERPACHECGWNAEPRILEIHHADRNRYNNRRENLSLVCPNCHTLHHFREGTGQFTSNIGRLTSLAGRGA
jgi:hypothetical protein